ncbi:MAG TPA: sugar-transfer associated ATP-grasp domain-containing protein [Myxococcota bacterium]|nr:sugar-transfer associated ATP-grasp domain-containing protein [Myxococcota bacterium]
MPLQALDMLRAWWATGLSPRLYHRALLARHSGGPAIRHYLSFDHLALAVRELQLDRFGEPPFHVNDKVAFGAWRRAQKLPGPEEIALVHGSDTLEPDQLDRLGDRLIVKPRASSGGKGVRAWERARDGSWVSEGLRLSPPALVEWIRSQRCQGRGGVLIQERLANHSAILGLCGETLSTCRIVTIRNERGEPEVVEFVWRMATRADAPVDNFHAGGAFFAVRDLATGELAVCVGPGAAARQKLSDRHPGSGAPMIGARHPFFREACRLALEAHGRLPGLLLVGWDVATTPDGPALVEMNVPPGSGPLTQIASDGLEHSRYGEILGWHARAWLDEHAARSSHRRIGARSPTCSSWRAS